MRAKEKRAGSPKISTDPVTRLPVIECKHAALPHEENTPERLANILLAQEIAWYLGCGFVPSNDSTSPDHNDLL